MPFTRFLRISLFALTLFDPALVFASGTAGPYSSNESAYSNLLHAVNQRYPLQVSALLNQSLSGSRSGSLSRNQKLSLLTQVLKLAVIRASAEEHASSIAILDRFFLLDDKNGFFPGGWNPFQSPQVVRYNSSSLLVNETAAKAMEMVAGLEDPSSDRYSNEYKNEVILRFSQRYPSLGNDLSFVRHLGWRPLILQNIDSAVNLDPREAERFLAYSLTSGGDFEMTQKLLDAGVRYSIQQSTFFVQRIPVLCAAFSAYQEGRLKYEHLFQMIRDRDLDMNESCLPLNEPIRTPTTMAASAYVWSLMDSFYPEVYQSGRNANKKERKLLSLVLAKGGKLDISSHLHALSFADSGQDEVMVKRLSQRLPKEWFATPIDESGASREFRLFPGTAQALTQMMPSTLYDKVKFYHRSFMNPRLVKELIEHKLGQVDTALKRYILHQTQLVKQDPTLDLPLANKEFYLSRTQSLVYLASQKLLESEIRGIKRKRDEASELDVDQEHSKRREASVSSAN